MSRYRKKRPLTPGRPPPGGLRALVLDSLASLLATGLLPRKRGQPVLLAGEIHPGATTRRAYVMTNRPRSYHQRFVPDRRRLWGLMRRVAALALRYRREAATASAAWAGGIGRFQRPEAWAHILGESSQREKFPA